MHRSPAVHTALAGLALALLLPALAQAGEPGEAKEKDKEKKVERKVVAVRVLDGEEPDVKFIPFDGKLGPRSYLGVGLTDLTPELRSHFGVPDDAGVMVSRVDPGSPAEKAGLKVGDIVTSFDGKSIESSFDLRLRVREAEDGAQAPIEVWRGGRAQTLTANLEKRERPELDLGPLFMKKNGDRMMLLGDGEGGKHFDLPVGDLLEQVQAAPGVRVQRLHLREVELEKQLKALEKRIQVLERQLEKR